MRKIDKLTLRTFFPPFILTTTVVVFIFLMRFIMLYFEDFVGKNLGLDVFARLFFFFSLMTVPLALPLAVLLATLMCFGNLGEHTELTAMKSAGIPITRVILPTAIVAALVSIGSFLYNNHITPWANLKGYSMLYDIKTTKLTLNIEEGIFYNELPGYRIKVQKKLPDNKTLKGVMVYDHSSNSGNRNVTVADSGRMYTINNDNYLVFELYNGYNYIEQPNESGSNDTPFIRNQFKSNRIVFSLSTFGMKRTDESQFKYHEFMKNIAQLNGQIDSTRQTIHQNRLSQRDASMNTHSLQFKKAEKIAKIASNKRDTLGMQAILPGPWIDERLKTLSQDYQVRQTLEQTKSDMENHLATVQTGIASIDAKEKEMFRAEVEKWHKFTLAVACFVMFLIGASLGTIIKRGGFGMPVLVSVSFFILMYILMQLGDKYAKEGIWNVLAGVWMPNAVLLTIGLYLLSKATNDARLFDGDVYHIAFEKLRKRFSKNKTEVVVS